MKHNNYWPQAQLYLYATCALFPEKISGRTLTTDQLDEFIPHYFESDEQSEVLDRLKSLRFLDYKRTDYSDGIAEFVIDDIDDGKFTDYLYEYLEKFRNDELLGDASNKPEPFKALQKRLYAYLSDSTRTEPVINPTNIWSDWIAGDMRQRPFWEVILTSDMVNSDTKTLDIGISATKNSINDEISVPFAKLAIQNPAAIASDTKIYTKRLAANLEIRNFGNNERKLILVLENEQSFIFHDSLRTDMPPHSLMKHLIANPGKQTTISYVRTKLDGCADVKNLSEVIRDCDFDKTLKDIFFDEMSRTSVRLRQNPVVTMDELYKSSHFKSGRIVSLPL